ncbi:hypothetical protein [Rhizobium leguminosarum]|uniref:hypothetical protein n=1 Tax=Rhizobium leguminosarum TaxID=384 RepID=UPI00103002B6|nr:hypothetical protein [Rhizobium leguminosarum]TAV10228.1 hypothetical protein ELI37_06775 [Rhizobium leguminosarum]TBZ66318.1 hypothetical protein E0H61_35035 [Rhizobium leguminosarum bv. viciae]TBZ88999.1 hypothetical protein E0H56_23225 [Rhizobium leguminosarum bv. viciae]
MTLDEIREEYRSRWGELPVGSVCLDIIDFVASKPLDQLRFLTFTTLAQATGRDVIDTEVLAAINLLTASRLAILESHAMLVDEDDTEHELSREEFAEARKTGTLIHPETGEAVPDFEAHVIPFFTPTEELQRELAHD